MWRRICDLSHGGEVDSKRKNTELICYSQQTLLSHTGVFGLFIFCGD